MDFLGLNSSVLTPRGFRPVVHGPRDGLDVAPRQLWGADDIAAVRDAPLVRVDGTGPDGTDDGLVLRSVLALALAGVPVTAHGLPAAVRQRLDPVLLTALDAVTPERVRDPGDRELCSLALRRRAWQLVGYRPRTDAPPVVLVLLPPGELPATLVHDLEGQVTEGLVVRTRQVPEGPEAERAVSAEGATYVTRMVPGLRYGPHHLADLVHALGHSGARVALSPPRFLPWNGHAWLEDGRGPSETPAEDGLAGGSLWYAADGATEPAAAGEGYAVHGAGAVPVRASGGPATGELATGERATGEPAACRPEDAPVTLRLHSGTPRVLDWHSGLEPDRADVHPVGPSYFALAASG